jgi:hypothetical protein
MDFRVQQLFMRQIDSQCDFALRGAKLLDEGLEQARTADVWVGCQQLVDGAGNVAKGQRKPWTLDRAPLRTALAVSEDSALKSTLLRNDLEHMDERIEKWAHEGHPMFADGNIGGGIVGVDPRWVFRHLSTSTRRVTFWENEFQIDDVVAELTRIQPLARQIHYG